MVRAKFECLKNTAGQVHLVPVTGGSKENAEFFSATPGGQIQLLVVNPPAAAAFIVGKAYYVDFHQADVAPQLAEKERLAQAAELAEKGMEQARGAAPPPPKVKQTKGP